MTKREYVWALVRTTVALSLMALALWGGDLASWAYSSLDACGIRILIGATALALLAWPIVRQYYDKKISRWKLRKISRHVARKAVRGYLGPAASLWLVGAILDDFKEQVPEACRDDGTMDGHALTEWMENSMARDFKEKYRAKLIGEEYRHDI